MTNMKSTKRALISSVFALVLCFAMLLGTTYAWFTDEVSSEGNIIQTGTLDIEMHWADKYQGDNTAWNNIEDEDYNTVFGYQHWEPGYTEVKYVQIKNVGSLAFEFKLDIVPNIQLAAGKPNLAEVIDVYMFAADATIDRAAIDAATPVGTLAELMAEADGAAHGVLLPDPSKAATDVNANENDNTPAGEIVYCIVLKMQEDAGNEYQGLSVGDGFTLKLMATQYTWENDAFDHLYDEGAKFDEAPKATVTATEGKWIDVFQMNDPIWANTTFQFLPNETEEEALANGYGLYHADFVVYADQDIPANSILLPGYYQAFCESIDNRWVALTNEETIPAGTKIRLVELLGVTVNYSEICKYGNDGTGFLCGVSAVADENGNYVAAGATITVELHLYATPEQGGCAVGGGCKHPSFDCETGEDYIVSTFTYTIPATTADRTTQP